MQIKTSKSKIYTGKVEIDHGIQTRYARSTTPAHVPGHFEHLAAFSIWNHLLF